MWVGASVLLEHVLSYPLLGSAQGWVLMCYPWKVGVPVTEWPGPEQHRKGNKEAPPAL